MSYLGRQPFFSKNARDLFSGNGATVSFNLSFAPGSSHAVLVSVAGAVQISGVDYSVVGKSLNFISPPAAGANNIQVVYLGEQGITTTNDARNIIIDHFVGDGVTTGWTLSASPVSPNAALVVVGGVVQRPTTDYVISSNICSVNPAAPNGVDIYVYNLGTALVIGVPSNNSVGSTQVNATLISGLTEDVAPQDADFVMTYDTSTGTLKKVAFSAVASTPTMLPRGTLSTLTATPDLEVNSCWTWAATGNLTLNNPAVIPEAGTWYVDIVVNSTGGYTLTLGSNFRTVFGFSFGCEPNSRYRLWMVSSSDGKLDTSIERIV
jgi:hypothetical protein